MGTHAQHPGTHHHPVPTTVHAVPPSTRHHRRMLAQRGDNHRVARIALSVAHFTLSITLSSEVLKCHRFFGADNP